MKRLILLILPIILAAQIPLNMTNLVPSDWKETFDFGMKWTSLLLNSFSAVTNDEKENELIPEGFVTTTVAMSIVPVSADLDLQIDRQVSLAQCQVERAKEALKLQREVETLHSLEIRIKRI